MYVYNVLGLIPKWGIYLDEYGCFGPSCLDTKNNVDTNVFVVGQRA